MTTTVEQKASILGRWAAHRLERGLPADVKAQANFNWPSLTPGEVAEVMKALQRRKTMAKNTERPSAPSRLAKHVVYCELGHRRYVESFTDPRTARAFVDLVLKGEKFKWKSTTTIAAKDGVLVITSALLEELMEMKEPKGVELPEPIPNHVEAFLLGHWPKKGARSSVDGDEDHDKNAGPGGKSKAKSSPVGKARVVAPGEVSLAELCETGGWEPRAVRIAMRREKWQKPEGGWVWPRKSGIEKKLRELMS
jgi:hypothetical protein